MGSSPKLGSLSRSQQQYGTLIKKDPKRNPHLENYPMLLYYIATP